MNRREKEQRAERAKVFRVIMYIWFLTVLIPIYMTKKSILPPLGCILLFVVWAAGIPLWMFLHNRMLVSPGKNAPKMNIDQIVHKAMGGIFCGSILVMIIAGFLFSVLPWYIPLMVIFAAIAVGAVSFIVGYKVQNKIEAQENAKQ